MVPALQPDTQAIKPLREIPNSFCLLAKRHVSERLQALLGRGGVTHRVEVHALACDTCFCMCACTNMEVARASQFQCHHATYYPAHVFPGEAPTTRASFLLTLNTYRSTTYMYGS